MRHWFRMTLKFFLQMVMIIFCDLFPESEWIWAYPFCVP